MRCVWWYKTITPALLEAEAGKNLSLRPAQATQQHPVSKKEEELGCSSLWRFWVLRSHRWWPSLNLGAPEETSWSSSKGGCESQFIELGLLWIVQGVSGMGLGRAWDRDHQHCDPAGGWACAVPAEQAAGNQGAGLQEERGGQQRRVRPTGSNPWCCKQQSQTNLKN